MKTILSLICVQILITKVLLHDIPSYVPLCKRNDPELSKCFINAVNVLRPYLRKGIPEMELPPGDPLQYHDAKGSTTFGRVQIEGKVWNQTAYGLMEFDFKDITIDFENAKCKVSVFFPNVRLEGQYNIKGKVLLFDIDTTGTFQINTTNLLANAEFIGRYYTKKSKQFIEFQEVDLKLVIKESAVYFKNLIPGNEELTRTLNEAINESIDTITKEVLPVLELVFSEIIQLYFNSVFRLYPLDTLFPTK